MRPALPIFAVLVLPTVAAAQTASLELVPARATVVAGQEVRFELRGAGAARPIWLIGPFDVASVTQQGVVRGLRHGAAHLVVRVGNRTVSAEVTVEPKPPATVTLSAEPASVVPSGVTVVEATPYTMDRDPVTTHPVSFRSTAPQVATVDAAGVVVGRAPGQATIVAEAGPARGELAIRVVPNRVSRLEVAGPGSARTGDVVRFSARALGQRGESVDPAPVRWAVDRAGASIYQDGGFVAERPGTYLVTATVGTVAAATPITVTQRVHDRGFEAVGSVTFGHLQAAEHWAINDALYVSTVSDRLYTFDISDPANPRLTDSLIVDARLINDVSTTPDGKIGVITRQQASSRKNGIVFLDFTQPLHPKVLSEYTETVSGGVHSAYIDGHYVYLNDDNTQSMVVISFADPRNPKEVGRWRVETTLARQEPDRWRAGRSTTSRSRTGLRISPTGRTASSFSTSGTASRAEGPRVQGL